MPAVLHALLAVSLAAGAPTPQGASEYDALVSRYAAGDAAPVAELAAWPPARVAQVVLGFPRTDARSRTLAGMLHTDVAVSLIDDTPDLAAFHLDQARSLLRATPDRTFLQHWYGLVVNLHASRGDLGRADAAAYDGLRQFPRDPALYVLRGTIAELRVGAQVLSRMRAGGLPRGDAPLAHPSVYDREARRTARGVLDAAAADYRRALEIDPRSALARLRLGWTHVLLRNDLAQTELSQVLADTTAGDVRCLAHLFLGYLAERRGDLEGALEQHEAARRETPDSQTACVALSRAEAALGRTERARATALACATLHPRREDPWWAFYLGGFMDADALDALRAEARR